MPSRRLAMRARNSSRLGAELLVGELFRLRLEGVDGGNHGQHALDGAVVGGAEDFGEGFIEEHGKSPSGSVWVMHCSEGRGRTGKGCAGHRRASDGLHEVGWGALERSWKERRSGGLTAVLIWQSCEQAERRDKPDEEDGQHRHPRARACIAEDGGGIGTALGKPRISSLGSGKLAVIGQELQNRMRVSLGALYASFGAGNGREGDGGDCHP